MGGHSGFGLFVSLYFASRGAFVILFVWCQGRGHALLCSLGMNCGFSLSCVIIVGQSGLLGLVYGLSGLVF